MALSLASNNSQFPMVYPLEIKPEPPDTGYEQANLGTITQAPGGQAPLSNGPLPVLHMAAPTVPRRGTQLVRIPSSGQQSLLTGSSVLRGRRVSQSGSQSALSQSGPPQPVLFVPNLQHRGGPPAPVVIQPSVSPRNYVGGPTTTVQPVVRPSNSIMSHSANKVTSLVTALTGSSGSSSSPSLAGGESQKGGSGTLTNPHRTVCGLVYNRKQSSKNSSGVVKEYMCNFCHFRSDVYCNFNKHLTSHIFTCNHCSFKSFTRFEVISHKQEKHPQFIEELQGFEGFGLSGKDGGISMLPSTSPPASTPVAPPAAPEKPSQNGGKPSYFTYKVHEDSSGRVTSYECGVCGHSTSDLYLMYDHATTHTLSDLSMQNCNTSWECFHCTFASFTQSRVISHIHQKHPGREMKLRRRTIERQPLRSAASEPPPKKAAEPTEEESLWGCYYCQTQNTDRNLVIEHLKSNHPNRKLVITRRRQGQEESLPPSGSAKSQDSTSGQPTAPKNTIKPTARPSRRKQAMPSKIHGNVVSDSDVIADMERPTSPPMTLQIETAISLSTHEADDYANNERSLGKVRAIQNQTKEPSERIRNKQLAKSTNKYDRMIADINMRTEQDMQEIRQLWKPGKTTPTSGIQTRKKASPPKNKALAITTGKKPQTKTTPPPASTPTETEPMVTSKGKSKKELKKILQTIPRGNVVDVFVLKEVPEDLKADYTNMFKYDRNRNSARCNLCNHTVGGQRCYPHMVEHVMGHAGARQWGCPYCVFRCNRRIGMFKHVRSKHPGGRLCIIRRKAFSDLAKHKGNAVLSNMILYRDVGFTSDEKLSKVTIIDGGPISVSEMATYFQSDPDAEIDPTDEEDQKQVKGKLRGPRSVRDAMALQTAVKMWQCPFCSRVSVFLGDIRIHMKLVHPDKDINTNPLKVDRSSVSADQILEDGEQASQLKKPEVHLIKVEDMENFQHLNEVLETQGESLFKDRDVDTLSDKIENVIVQRRTVAGKRKASGSFSRHLAKKRRVDMPLKSASPHVGKYKCGHCSFLGSRAPIVKSHIMAEHKDADITIVDLRASSLKLSQARRLYMCHDLGCTFITPMKKALYVHLGKFPGHQGATDRAAASNTSEEQPVTRMSLRCSSLRSARPNPIVTEEESMEAEPAATTNERVEIIDFPAASETMDNHEEPDPDESLPEVNTSTHLPLQPLKLTLKLNKSSKGSKKGGGTVKYKSALVSSDSSEGGRSKTSPAVVKSVSDILRKTPPGQPLKTGRNLQLLTMKKKRRRRDDKKRTRDNTPKLQKPLAMDRMELKCSYCDKLSLTTDPAVAKRHLIEKHANSRPVAVDVFAYSLRKASRVMFCSVEDCLIAFSNRLSVDFHMQDIHGLTEHGSHDPLDDTADEHEGNSLIGSTEDGSQLDRTEESNMMDVTEDGSLLDTTEETSRLDTTEYDDNMDAEHVEDESVVELEPEEAQGKEEVHEESLVSIVEAASNVETSLDPGVVDDRLATRSGSRIQRKPFTTRKKRKSTPGDQTVFPARYKCGFCENKYDELIDCKRHLSAEHDYMATFFISDQLALKRRNKSKFMICKTVECTYTTAQRRCLASHLIACGNRKSDMPDITQNSLPASSAGHPDVNDEPMPDLENQEDMPLANNDRDDAAAEENPSTKEDWHEVIEPINIVPDEYNESQDPVSVVDASADNEPASVDRNIVTSPPNIEDSASKDGTASSVETEVYQEDQAVESPAQNDNSTFYESVSEESEKEENGDRPSVDERDGSSVLGGVQPIANCYDSISEAETEKGDGVDEPSAAPHQSAYENISEEEPETDRMFPESSGVEVGDALVTPANPPAVLTSLVDPIINTYDSISEAETEKEEDDQRPEELAISTSETHKGQQQPETEDQDAEVAKEEDQEESEMQDKPELPAVSSPDNADEESVKSLEEVIPQSCVAPTHHPVNIGADQIDELFEMANNIGKPSDGDTSPFEKDKTREVAFHVDDSTETSTTDVSEAVSNTSSSDDDYEGSS